MKYLFNILFLLLFTTAFGQKQIDGFVFNESNEPLVGATLVLLNESDSTMVSFGITNEKGAFRLNEVETGKYLIQASFISYNNSLTPVNVEPDDKKLSLDPIILQESSTILQEIEVSAEHIPMGIKGDTISYNAAAFKTRPGATVEELLKKLPGIEVERNGNIKAQGEDVENVLVDGKEFFGSDPTMATKNLEAEAVDKVEVYDKKSEIAEFTGIDDGNEEKTIDLKLKEDHKKGGFGNINLAGGTTETYDTKINYFRFSPALQASLIFSANNINKETFSINDRIDFMGGIGNLMAGGGLNISQYQGLDKGLNNSLSTGLNFNYDLSSRMQWRSHYIYNQTANSLDQFREVTTFTDAINFLQQDSLDSEKQNHAHQVNTKLDFELNPLTEIIIKNNLNWTNNLRSSFSAADYFRNQSFSGNTTSGFNSNNDEFSYEGSLLYKRKFEKLGRSLISSFNYFNTKDLAFEDIDNLNQVGINHFRINQDQEFKNLKHQGSASINYTEPISKRYFLGLSYQYGISKEKPVRDYFDLIENQRLLNDELSAEYDKTYIYNIGGVSLRRNTKKLKMSLALKAQYTRLLGVLSNQEDRIDGSFVHFLPGFDLNYEMKGGKSMDVNYQTNVIAPELEQLMPFPNNTNPNFTMLGNPELIPEYNHQFQIGFNYFDNFSFTSFWSRLDLNYSQDRIVYKSNIDENLFQTLQPVNTEEYFGINAHLSFSRPFRPLKINYKIRARLRYANYDSFINDLESNVQDNNLNLRLSINNRKTKYISMETGVTFNIDNKRYQINDAFNQDFFSTDYFIDGEFYLPKGWTVASELIYRNYSQASFSDNPSFYLWSASIGKFFLEEKLELRISAYDLLKQNIGYERTTSTNSLSQSFYTNLSRYFMLGVYYRIGNTKGGGGIQIEVD